MKLYRGVVEDNNHPDKNGMVKVRIYEIHTEKNSNSDEDFEVVDTDDLVWSEVLGSTSFGLVGGVGVSSVLKQGTWVWVILENDDPNKPVVVGTISGMNTESPVGKQAEGEGFYDPDEKFPFVSRSSESDLNRLARNEKLDEEYYDESCPIYGLKTTIHQKIQSNLDSVSITDSTSGADVSQDEPESLSNNTEYPKSSVLETESGHVIEIDDTPSNERIRLFHMSGSYMEIRPDGTFVQKSANEDSESHYIHMSSVDEHIKRSLSTYIEENLDEIIGGYVKRNIKGALQEHVEKDVVFKSDKNVLWEVGGNFTLKVNGKIDIDAGPEIDLDAALINLN